MSRLLFESESRILASWRFNTANAGESGTGYEAEGTAPDGSAGNVLDAGANVTLSVDNTFGYDGSPVLRVAPATSASVNVADAVTNSSYASFTYTPNSDRRVVLEKLTFRVARGGATTPRGWALRSSLDNYATNIATADVSTQRPVWTDVTVDLAAYQTVAAPITFRLYAYTPAIGSSLEFDNLELWGFAEAKAAISGTGALLPGAATDGTTSTRFTPGSRLRFTGGAPVQPGVITFWVNFPVLPTVDTTVFMWNVDDAGTPYPRTGFGVFMDGGVAKFQSLGRGVTGNFSWAIIPGQWYKITMRMKNSDGSGVECHVYDNAGSVESSTGPFGTGPGTFVSITVNGDEAAGNQGSFDLFNFRIYNVDYDKDDPVAWEQLRLDGVQPQSLLPTRWLDLKLGGDDPTDFQDRSGNGRDFTESGNLGDGLVAPYYMYPNQSMGLDGVGDIHRTGRGHLMAGYTAPAFPTGCVRFSSNNTGYLTRAITGSLATFSAVFKMRLNQEPTLDFTTPFQVWHSTGYGGGGYCQIYLGDGGSARRSLWLDTSTIGGTFEDVGYGNLIIGREYSFGLVLDDVANEVRLYLDGALIFTKTGVTGSIDGPNVEIRSGAEGTGAAFIGDIARVRLWSRVLTHSEITAESGFERAVADDAALIGDWPLPDNASLEDAAHGSNAMTSGGTTGNGPAFAGGARASMLSGSGSILVEHTGTGALAAAAATMSGAGKVTEVGSGGLAAGAATLAGTGATQEAGSGALAAGAATASGTGKVEEVGSGAMAASPATMSGAGVVRETGSGALQAAAATMSGAGARVVLGTGALAAGTTTMAGTGKVEEAGSGALQAAAAVVAGAGKVEEVGSGALQASAATMSGAGSHVVPGSGALAAAAATAAGAGVTNERGTGAMAAGAATMSGAGKREVPGTGALAAAAATIAGAGNRVVSGTGALATAAASTAGAGSRVVSGSGAPVAAAATMSGAGNRVVSGTGDLAAAAAAMSGAGKVAEVGSGAMQAAAAAMAGTGDVDDPVAGGTGVLVADPATMSGAGKVTEVGSGALVAGATTLAGVGVTNERGAGALAAGAATMSGAGMRNPTGVGAVQAGAAVVDGVGSVRETGSGALVCGAAAVSGSGIVLAPNSAAIFSGPATMSGVGAVTEVGSGVLVSAPATMSGQGRRVVAGVGALAAAPAVVAGSGVVAHPGSGALSAAAAALAGVGNVAEVGSGALVCAPVVIEGIGGQVRIGNGALQAGVAVVAGAGVRNTFIVGAGALASGAATMNGVGKLLPASLVYIDRVGAEVTVVPYDAQVWVGTRDIQTAVLMPDVDVSTSVSR